MPRTVKIIRIYFLEDDIYEGSIPQECYDNAREELIECDDVEEAVRFIRSEGLTFGASGGGWAANPDGSRIVNYATAEREEASAHLDGWTDAEAEQIERLVDA